MSVKNLYGITIKVCCASCEHRDMTRATDKRCCQKYGYKIDQCNIYEDWQMSQQMKAAGKGGGRVKKRSYQLFLLAIREAEAARGETKPMSLPQVRAAYTRKYGSIFENI